MSRLPTPGADDGNWGNILNDYLSKIHKADGTLKDNVVSSSAIAPNAVDESVIGATGGTDGQVLVKDAGSSSGLSWQTVSGGGPIPDANATTKGLVQLAGDLSGSASAPAVAKVKGVTLPVSAPIAGQVLTATSATASSWQAPTPQQSSDWTASSGVTRILNKPSLSQVATTGSYNDLSAKPVIPSVLDNLSDVSASGATDGQSLVYNGGTWGPATVSSGSPAVNDATSTTKGIVQLTGDLGGTAASPTVPGLASKANTSALANYVPTSQKGAANGVASLDGTGKVPVAQLPATSSPVTSVSGKTGDVTLVKGDVGLSNVDNTTDANKPISTATQTALSAKADNSATVHNTGTETIAGVKTFSSSPIVPTPTTGTQVANKSYVDSVGGSGAPDATSSTKGIVQLTGDLGGTAASPTVPGLSGKVDDTRSMTGANSITGGGDLTANRTFALVNDSASPGVDKYYGTNAGGTKGWYTLSGGGSSGQFGHIFLDDQAGANDDAKLTAAIAAQQSTAGMPPIVLGARNHSFNQTRTLYSGLKLIGQSTGPKNLEQDPDFVTSRITLGGAVSSGTSSWWVTPGGNLFDIYMGDFAVQGNAGSSVHQFIDVNSGSLYACEFHSLAFNFMRSVFGRKDRKCLMTQVVFSGHWTANNLWDTQFFLGGADCQLWVGGYINIGPSSSPAQTGTYADNDYQLIFDNLTKTDIGYIFTSSLNGWRGLKVTGNSGHGLRFFGGTYEGYKSSNDNLAAPGTVIRLEGGSGAFFGPSIGQAMQSPNAAEGGPVHMTGGEWTFYSPNFYRSPMADTEPCIYHSGGRLLVLGATRHEGEAWSTRPRYFTSSSGPNSTETSFYCPDMSMVSA